MPDVFGEHLTLAELAAISGLKVTTIAYRRSVGHSISSILANPVHVPASVGARFGSLVAVAECEQRSASKKKQLLCRCDCGNERIVIAADLRSGRTTSCGCARSRKSAERRISAAEDMRGKTFGDNQITVSEQWRMQTATRHHGEKRRVREWMCRCQCGSTFWAKAAALKRGQVTSCGCLRKKRAQDQAPCHIFFGVELTLLEISELTGTGAATIAYRMRKLGMTAEQAAMCAPLRHHTTKPKGRGAKR